MKFYKYFDIVKLLFSFIIVSIHIKNTITNIYWTHLTGIAVPMFFTLSAILFWGKIRWNNEHDIIVIKHYIGRLFILISAWSILLLPFWLPQFIIKYPSQWHNLLLPKLLLYGGCRGGYFIMSLIYGTIILYIMHRFLNRHVVFLICLLFTAYYQFIVTQVIPDFLHIRHNDSIVNTDFLPFRFLLYIELAIYIIPSITKKITEKKMHKLIIIILFLIVLTSFIKSAFVYFVCSTSFLVLFCSYLCSIKCEQLSNISVAIRKMSIVIFLFHFIIIDYGESLITSFLNISSPLMEYSIVLPLTVLIAYILVTYISQKMKFIRYLY